GESGVEMRLFGESAETGDLTFLALGIRGRETVLGFQRSDLLSRLEPLSQHVDEGGIDVVDAPSQTGELRGYFVIGHALNLPPARLRLLRQARTPRAGGLHHRAKRGQMLLRGGS